MRYKRLLTAVGAAMVLVAPAASQAQTQMCADREIITQRLEAGYGETFSGGGLRNQESVLEVWTSEAEGTWTILMTHANGTSCVMASGTAWRGALPSQKVLGIPG